MTDEEKETQSDKLCRICMVIMGALLIAQEVQ